MKCPKCEGSGVEGYDRSYPPNPYVCDLCEGSGEVRECEGTGTVKKFNKEDTMKQTVEKISINGVDYVKADSVSHKATMKSGMEYVMCRTYSAGVFAGYLEKREGKEVTLRNARRIWKWSGAASLSQLSVDGTSDPDNCKFPVEVDKVLLLEAIEIIPCTEKARLSIAEVKIWKK